MNTDITKSFFAAGLKSTPTLSMDVLARFMAGDKSLTKAAWCFLS